MRITKLHILIFFLMLGLGFSGAYQFKMRRAAEREREAALELLREKEKAEAERLRAESEPPPVEVSTAAAAAPEPAPPAEVTYTVQKGDTLWAIAKKKEHFGQGHRWYDIWKANEDRIPDFDRVPAGEGLTIPLDKPENHPWERTSEEKKRRLLGQAPPPAPEAPPVPAPSN